MVYYEDGGNFSAHPSRGAVLVVVLAGWRPHNTKIIDNLNVVISRHEAL